LEEHNILGGLDISNLPYTPSFQGDGSIFRSAQRDPPIFPPSQGGDTRGVNNAMLLCVTEMNSKEDIDALVAALAEFR
jgi:hypothetical protein